jgi:hypothetical protein
MPKRSNKFQALIYSIEQSIAGSGWSVAESHEILDEDTGEPREIDIFIVTTNNGVTEKIAIECRDYSRPQEIDFIEKLRGKYEDMIKNGEVSKIIAVSSSGFYEPALIKAKKWGIRTLTFEEATKFNWGESAGHFRTTIGKYKRTKARGGVMLEDNKWLDFSRADHSNAVVLGPDGLPIGKIMYILGDFARELAKSEEKAKIDDAVRNNWVNGEYTIPIKISGSIESNNLSTLDRNGVKKKLIRIYIEWHIQFDAGSSIDDHYIYDEKDIIMGSTVFDSLRFDHVLVNNKGNKKMAQFNVQPASLPSSLWQKKK